MGARQREEGEETVQDLDYSSLRGGERSLHLLNLSIGYRRKSVFGSTCRSGGPKACIASTVAGAGPPSTQGDSRQIANHVVVRFLPAPQGHANGILAGDLDRHIFVRLLVGESFRIAAQERGYRYKRKT